MEDLVGPDLTVLRYRVSRVRAVWHWWEAHPVYRVQRVIPGNGVTEAIKEPRETRAHQVDFQEPFLCEIEEKDGWRYAMKKIKKGFPPLALVHIWWICNVVRSSQLFFEKASLKSVHNTFFLALETIDVSLSSYRLDIKTVWILLPKRLFSYRFLLDLVPRRERSNLSFYRCYFRKSLR